MQGRVYVRAAWLCAILALTSEFLPSAQANPGAKDSGQVALALPSVDSAVAAKDTTQRKQGRADSVVLIKHRFNHKEQIITGGVIMACLAAMMAVMNNYNPR